jgi:multicomponent Na+:H+ antiporter subunit D
MSQYLIFQIITPIFFSLINIIFSSNKITQWIFLFSTFINLIFLIPIFSEIINSENSNIIYLLGDYSNQYGIELKLNFFSFIFLAIINYTAFILSIYKFNFKNFSYKTNSLLLFAITGFIGIVISNDIFNIYVFLEISSLASYALVASNNYSLPSLYASFNYLIFGTIGATFYLIGVAFLYLYSGTLNISILLKNTGILTNYNQSYIFLSFFFIISGLLLKIGIFPIHNWLNNIYKKSENYLSIFFSGTSTIISIYIFCLFAFNIFVWSNYAQKIHFNYFLEFIGGISIIYFSFLAYANQNAKKILIYSSLAQIGYFLCCLGIGTKESIAAFCFQLINHGISKSILFALFSHEIFHHLKSPLITKIHFLLTSIFILNLIGIPLFFGFFAKFNMITSIIKSKNNFFTILSVTIGTFFSILYGLKLLRIARYRDDPTLTKKYELGINREIIDNNFISEKQFYCFILISALPIFFSIYFYNSINQFIINAVSNLLIFR